MTGGKSFVPLGYTIVEVMIFLAVSGVMFIIAAGFVNGKQANVSFHNETNTLNSKVSNTINDVENGFYPQLSLTCSGNGATNVTAGTSAQGTNSQCIFLGKAIDFSDDGYTIVSLAGSRLSSNTEATTINEADPAAIPGADDVETIGGSQVEKVCSYFTDGDTVDGSYGFALLSNVGILAASPSASGQPTTAHLYGFDNPVPKYTGSTNLDADNAYSDIKDADSLSKVIVYIGDKGSRNAAITIGDNGSLSTTITYSSSPPSGCPS